MPSICRFSGASYSDQLVVRWRVIAYRVIYCILKELVAGYDDVVRDRCNNRHCINPNHLEIDSRGDNLQDEREFAENGVDHDLL